MGSHVYATSSGASTCAIWVALSKEVRCFEENCEQASSRLMWKSYSRFQQCAFHPVSRTNLRCIAASSTDWKSKVVSWSRHKHFGAVEEYLLAMCIRYGSLSHYSSARDTFLFPNIFSIWIASWAWEYVFQPLRIFSRILLHFQISIG